MASYKILATNSTLGEAGATVTDEDIMAASVDVDVLILAGTIESSHSTQPKTPKE